MRGVGKVTAEDESAVGCIGGAGVRVVICFSWLADTVDGETGGDKSAGLLFDQHLAAEEDGFGLDTRPQDELERLVCLKMYPEFFDDP